MTSTLPCETQAISELTSRLHRVLKVHFDPDHGTPFWLDRATSLGIEPISEIRELADLHILGDMVPTDLTNRPLLDYVPRRFHSDMSDFVICQTGGTTGHAAWTTYRRDEFAEAFITPFTTAARHVGFPEGESWLYVGPSGPHVIGKAVSHLANSLDSHDPFCVDFDPRWAKRLPQDSLSQQRYLKHVTDQAMAIIASQDIGVLFTTPAVLRKLAETMTVAQRSRIRGIHYGGMTLASEELENFQASAFSNAIHLSGYGNTLFGCCLELSVQPGRQLDYFPHGSRLHFDVIDDDGQPVPPKTTGQVRFTRLDESFLIVRMLERDVAELVELSPDAPSGFSSPGLRNPHSPTTQTTRHAVGLY